MRSGRRILSLAGVVLVVAAACATELQQWVQHLPAGALLRVFLRTVPMPGGTVSVRRPPSETRPELTRLIVANSNQAALYRLRARRRSCSWISRRRRMICEGMCNLHPIEGLLRWTWRSFLRGGTGRSSSWKRSLTRGAPAATGFCRRRNSGRGRRLSRR